MTQTIEANGQCLCGKVEVATNEMNPNLGAGHCQACRNWGEGLLLAIFIDQKPSYYGFSNSTINKTGAEVFEQAQQEENKTRCEARFL